MEFKEQIQRILENVPKVYEAGSSSIKNEVSNALKGSASGEAVALKDVSPVEHSLKVSISGVDNPEAVKVLVQGANLLSLDKINRFDNCSFESGVIKQTEADTNPLVYFKVAVTLNNGEQVLIAQSDTVTVHGKVTFQFTCNEEINTFRFGLNGRVKDTAVIFEGLGLPAGTYIVSCNVINATQGSISWKDMQIALIDTDYEPYKEPIEYAQGEEIKSIYPSTTLMTDTAGAVLTVEYNKDINKAFAELQKAIISIGGNV